ncbi:hypothetical protein BG006_010693 [Podila minutissima]|uniref:Uncharacterized protein n=1 Tax=Podila minutissima TaxID=64525 RepID=A0A9P5SGL5_9FUNG|nr:hypothetical protein BG006_010693 [Podila minutissima]
MRNLHIVIAAFLALIAMVAAASHTTSTTKTVAHKPKHSSTKKHTTTAHAKAKKTTTTKAKKTTTTVRPTSSKPTATPTSKPGKQGQAGVVLSQTAFCLWLPPVYGGDIAANEDRAVAFCTKPNMPGAANAGVLPAGFIQSAHFVTDTQKGYVQVTGRLNRSKYGLSAKDGGGQYDMRAPVGAICNGYKAFVQLTEPDAQIYCIRCCMNKADCPVNKSTYGCKKVLGGVY